MHVELGVNSAFSIGFLLIFRFVGSIVSYMIVFRVYDIDIVFCLSHDCLPLISPLSV